MKKSPLILAIVAMAVSLVSLLKTSSSDELVYVDVNQLVEGYNRTEIERTKFEEKAIQFQANVDSLLSNWQAELMNYEKERSKMSKKEIELKKELLASKQEQITAYQQAIQKKISEEDFKSKQTVINDINDYIKEYGQEHNYKVIFGASGSGNIMYADEVTDLTQEILEGLNAEFSTK